MVDGGHRRMENHLCGFRSLKKTLRLLKDLGIEWSNTSYNWASRDYPPKLSQCVDEVDFECLLGVVLGRERSLA